MKHKGKIFKTNSCGEVVILNYINYQNVQNKFLDTGYETVKSFGNIQAKEDYIKEVAEKWKDQIDPRVYEALMKYEVDINDWHTSR